MTKQQVIDKAIGIMGSAKIANSWLQVRHPALEGKSAGELIETESGRTHVWEILCRMERDFSLEP